MYLTKKHISRRTVLRGMGVTVALPFLDAMVPARTLLAKTAAAGKTRLSCIEMVHGAAGSTVHGLAKNMWSPGSRRARVRSRAEQPEPARAVSRLPHDRQQHRRAERRGLPAQGDRRRSLPLERGVPDAGAPEADGGIGRPRRDLDGPDLRAAVRPGHADSLDAALHRERRSVGRLRLRLRLRLHRHDQLGGRRPSRCRWCAIRARRSISCSASAPRRTSAPPTGGPTAASSTGSPGEVARLRTRPRARATAAGSSEYLEDIREIERRIQKIEAHNASGEPRELPGAPVGVPDSFEEHVKLMFDLQALAFAADITRVFSFKMGRDGSARVYPESGAGAAVPPGVAPRRARGPHRAVRADQQVPRQPRALLPREAEEHPGRRQQPARQDARSSTARRWATRTSTTTSAARCSWRARATAT